MKRVLVTGGAGLIGSHLIRTLLGQGHHVTCLDKLSTGSETNLAGFIQSSSFRLIRQDVADPFEIEVEEIYNLACPASPVHYQADPVGTFKTSILGTLNMATLALRENATLLQASTSEVYGDPRVHPQREDYWGNVNPIGPRACYDEGKRGAETLLFDHHRQYGLPIKVARIFNTYGPNMHPDDGRVVSNFIMQALQGHNITIFGDGQQTRSFCYVEDLVDGLVRLMHSPASVTGPVNLGNPHEFTMRQLADLVIDLTGSSSRIVHLPLPVDDPRQRKPDITQATSQLGWAPVTPLREGLVRTIAYFDKLLSRQASVSA